MPIEITEKSHNFTILNNKHEIIRTFKLYQYTPQNMSCMEKHAEDNHDFRVMNMYELHGKTCQR